MPQIPDTPEIAAARQRYRAVMAVLDPPPFEVTAPYGTPEWADQVETKHQVEALQEHLEERFVAWVARQARQRIIDGLKRLLDRGQWR